MNPTDPAPSLADLGAAHVAAEDANRAVADAATRARFEQIRAFDPAAARIFRDAHEAAITRADARDTTTQPAPAAPGPSPQSEADVRAMRMIRGERFEPFVRPFPNTRK